MLKNNNRMAENKELFKALVSLLFSNDGLATLVYFTSIYAATSRLW